MYNSYHNQYSDYLVIYSNYPQINKGTVNLNGKDIKKTCIYSDIIIKKDTKP